MGRRKPAPTKYDKSYYSDFYTLDSDLPYERSEHWLKFFGRLADRIVADINPRTALDAGCAMGLLVEALRDRGVDAEGVDISEYAVGQSREDVRAHIRVGSILDPLPKRYDLIICIETLEHLPGAEAEQALENFCAHTDTVLFSSTPGHFKEATHVNVQPVEHWSELFARNGFLRDLDTDMTSVLTRWAGLYRRSDQPVHRVVAGYERLLWRLTDEVTDLRELAHDNRVQVMQLRAQLDAVTGELQRKLEGTQARLEAIERSRVNILQNRKI